MFLLSLFSLSYAQKSSVFTKILKKNFLCKNASYLGVGKWNLKSCFSGEEEFVMYEIREGLKQINGVVVDTFERDVKYGGTRLEVEAGTTGYRGGCCRDAGGRTYMRINCEKGDYYFRLMPDGKGIMIAACGDDALNALVTALDFCRDALNDLRCEVDD